MQHEHDVPDYAKDPDGDIIALDSHIRLANPRTPQTQSSLMMRRGYSYSLGVTNSGQLDMGLLFVCYQHDLEKGFLTVQKRLNGEALEEVRQADRRRLLLLHCRASRIASTTWRSLCLKPDVPARKGRAFSAVFPFFFCISCLVLFFL
nr:Ferrous iron transport peroxidase EfeB [Raoultella sp. NCTC 9187]